MVFDQFSKGLAAQKWDVPGEQYHGASLIAERSFSLLERMSRAELRLLDSRPNGRVLPTKLAYLIAGVARYHSHCVRSHSLRGSNHMVEQRQAADAVEDLRQLGLHPSALPGSQNHDVCQSLSRSIGCWLRANPSSMSTPAVMCTKRAYSLTLTRSSAENTSFRFMPVTAATPAMRSRLVASG